MSRFEFKAYGGTGSLVARSFITLLALNAANLNGDAHKNDKCVLYVMDYDDIIGNTTTDASYLESVISSYQNLYNRKLGFIAPIKLEKSPKTLKQVRTLAYGATETEYSLNSLFCQGNNGQEIKELLQASFTSDPYDATKSAELERSNANGCYGDLAVNGFISERLIATGAFKKSGIYEDLVSSINDAVIIYAGSTDGGTANTMIDKDIESFINYCNEKGIPTDSSRPFRMYALRSTPYSKFELSGDEVDVKNTKDILRDKFEMSKGVIKNIEQQNNDSLINPNVPSYFYLNKNTKYWLDGLSIGSSSCLDVTATVAKKDCQFHPSHFVEFALAEQAIDAIAHRLPEVPENVGHLFAYNDGADENQSECVTLESFFGTATVEYQFQTYKTLRGGDISLSKYIKAIILTLVTIRSNMIRDFKNFPNCHAYVADIFHGANGIEPQVCPIIARELESFLDEAKFIVMNFVNMMDYSKFNKNDATITFFNDALRYVYDTDVFGNSVTPPEGAGVYVNRMTNTVETGANPGSILADIHTRIFEPGGLGGRKIKKLNIYQRAVGATPEEKAKNTAHDMIIRLFETYLINIR